MGRCRISEYIYTYNKLRVNQYYLSTFKVEKIKIHEVNGYFDFQETLKAAGL